MISRRLPFLLMMTGLSGCSSPSLPKVDFYGMSLPRLDSFRIVAKEEAAPTMAYPLAPTEITDIKSSFSAAFQDGRTLEFGPITARKKVSGDLVVCGLVSVRTPAGLKSGMTLFDGTATPAAVPGRVSFTPKRIAGANAETIDVYSDCKDAGVL